MLAVLYETFKRRASTRARAVSHAVFPPLASHGDLASLPLLMGRRTLTIALGVLPSGGLRSAHLPATLVLVKFWPRSDAFLMATAAHGSAARKWNGKRGASRIDPC
jgi:hypothetical protein